MRRPCTTQTSRNAKKAQDQFIEPFLALAYLIGVEEQHVDDRVPVCVAWIARVAWVAWVRFIGSKFAGTVE